MRTAGLFLIIFIISGCTAEIKTERTDWFDMPELTRKLIANMSDAMPSVNKTFDFNGVSETKTIQAADSVFWKQEFANFFEVNLNTPLVRDFVRLETGRKDLNSNLMVDEYIVDEKSKSTIKELQLYYLDTPTEIRKISIRLNNSNLVSKSETEVEIWLNRYQELLLIDSLIVKSKEKTLLQSPRNYSNKLKVLW